MLSIMLNEEQSRLITDSLDPVEVRDCDGNVVGRILPLKLQEAIAEAKRRSASDQPRFTSEQVQAHFAALAEAVERDNLDDEQARALFARLQAETRT